MKINSIRFKISILYVVILGFILIVYSSILYFSLRDSLYNDFDEELLLKSNELINVINIYNDRIDDERLDVGLVVSEILNISKGYRGKTIVKDLDTQWLENVDRLDIEEDYVNILDSSRTMMFSSENMPPELIDFLSPKNLLNKKFIKGKNIRFASRNLRMIETSFTINKKMYFLQIISSVKPIIEILHGRATAIGISIPVILLLTSFIGWIIVARILKPVKDITHTARNITYEDLGMRVKTEHIDEEMKYLVDAFNDMIARLDNSFKHIAEFSSHVAHELKTPLAIIRGSSEVALRKDRSPEAYRQVLAANLDEVCRMLRIIDDLFLLTKLDYRPEIFKFENIDFNKFLEEICEQTSLLAEQKKIDLKYNLFSEQVFIRADKMHLRRLFFNLINNAIKFTYPKGQINIVSRYDSKKVFISISDNGIGISSEDLPKIFDKFFHVNRTNQNLESSSGLGLSIAQSIVKVHNGTIEVKSEFNKGATFTVILPTI